MRHLSLNARRSHFAAHSDETEIVLIMFEHPSLESPIRLSSDPSTRLSIEPLAYGTRSRWRDSNPVTEPFRFIIADLEMPGDQENTPTSISLVIDNVGSELTDILLSFNDWATMHLAIVLISSPDVAEYELADLKLTDIDIDEAQIKLTCSRPQVEDESVPMDRMTRDRFPGLFQ